MSRTDRLIAQVTSLIEQNRASIDADDQVRKFVIKVLANDGGYARFAAMQRCTEEGAPTKLIANV